VKWFDRILKVHQILGSARRPVPRTRLEDALECAPATVKRVIGRMRDYLQAPIEYDRSRSGYFYLLEELSSASGWK
jgi:predicted DNA-binding transcriptional regulator YafY